MQRKKRQGRESSPTRNDTVAGRVGQLIRARRQALGLTLQQVVERTGGEVSQAILAMYERGTQPSMVKFWRVCVALECRPEDLTPAEIRYLFEQRKYHDTKWIATAFAKRTSPEKVLA